ncbi:MAG: hypothetical protein AAF127_16125 [Pseudomonadota bacterium]
MRMIAAIAALTLAGCTQEEAVAPVEEGETNTQASGEVLGGTISDDMLPLESLESQSPPAERAAQGSRGASPETDDAPSD